MGEKSKRTIGLDRPKLDGEEQSLGIRIGIGIGESEWIWISKSDEGLRDFRVCF